jgi:dienelactone hydrolase
VITDPQPTSDDRADGPARWEQRFRAVRLSLPRWAADAPDACVLLSNATGTTEVYAWNLGVAEPGGTASGPGFRQITNRPNGTVDATVSRDGSAVWWFADTDGDEFGTWQSEPFPAPTGAPAAGAATARAEPALPGLPAAYDAGLAFGPGDLVVCGSADDEYGTKIHVYRAGATSVVYAHRADAGVGALSHDGTLLAVEHSEHGDSRHPAIRVLDIGGGLEPTTLGELWDGPGVSLRAVDFAPVDGDRRLLVQHERQGRPELLIWDLGTGTQRELAIDLPGALTADWLPDGSGLVVQHEHAARSALFTYSLDTGELSPLGTPTGSIESFAVRPDGAVWFAWSSAELPRRILSVPAGGGPVTPVLTAAGAAAAPSVPARDLWVEGPGGLVHALLRRPAPTRTPPPLYVDIHGGPTALDTDSFAAEPAAWVDAGFAVLSVNYRGSDGYGAVWRDALEADVGFTELADIAAVRDHLVATGEVDGDRCVLAGASWGGFLTLLGLGTQPERWAAGVAVVPVADYVAAYEDEMEPLKAFDRSLFGGSPTEVPDAYRRASPLTWVDAVRAPVLVVAGANDPRCPIRQIDTYLDALTACGHVHEVYRYDAGHGSAVVDERIRQVRIALDFVDRHLKS